MHTRAESSRSPAVRRAFFDDVDPSWGKSCAAFWSAPPSGPASLLSAGAAPIFANALDSQLQPVATPIPRETVPFDGREAPGTIIIRTSERRLYLVLPDHQALRYGVGVGRPGFTWAGVTRIGYKREWPDWTPPAADAQAPAGPPPAHGRGRR